MGYEIDIVHFCTEYWLINHGYNYRHHDSRFTKGIPDFVAWKMKNGKQFGDYLIIECKIDNSDKRMIDACYQLERYTKNASMPSVGAIAIPVCYALLWVRQAANDLHLGLIGVDIGVTKRIYDNGDWLIIYSPRYAPFGYDFSLNKPGCYSR